MPHLHVAYNVLGEIEAYQELTAAFSPFPTQQGQQSAVKQKSLCHFTAVKPAVASSRI